MEGSTLFLAAKNSILVLIFLIKPHDTGFIFLSNYDITHGFIHDFTPGLNHITSLSLVEN